MNTLLRLVAVLLLTIHLAACGADLSDAEYLAKAEKAMAEGRTREALINLKNALRKNGHNARARFLLGKLALERGDAASAEKELKRALELGVAGKEVLPLLADALRQLGKNEELLDLDATSLPPLARARVQAAQSLAALAENRKNDAKKLVNQALEEAPDSIHAAVAKARLLFTEGRQQEAIDLVEKVVKKNPDFAEGWRLLGDMHQFRREFEDAEKAYSRVVSLRPNELSSRLQRAMTLIQLRRFDEAQKDLDRIKKVAPQHGGTNYAQGLVYLGEKKLDDAISAFEQAVASGGANPLSLYFLGALHFARNNLEQADNYAQQFLSKFPGNVAGRKLEARIKLKMNDPRAVEELLQPVVRRFDKDVEAMELLATALLKAGKTGEAIKLLDKAAALQPESAQAQLRMGAGLLLEGEEAKAAEYLRKAAELDPENPRADILMVLGYLREKKYDEALEAANRYRQKAPSSPGPLVLIGRIELARGNRDAAVKSFEEAARMDPGNPDALDALARLAIQDEHLDQARKRYEEILARHENHLPTLIRLAALDARENREKEMVRHLRQAIAAHPGAVQPRIVLARYYLDHGEYETAMALLTELDDRQKSVPAVLEVMGMIQLAQKDYAQARITLEKLVELRPKSAQAHYLLARAWSGLNRTDKVESELTKALELQPDHFLSRLAHVRLLLARKKIDAARKEFAPLANKHPAHPEVMKLQAAFFLADGNREKAAEVYGTLLKKAPGTDTLITYSTIEWSLGHHDRAISLLADWVKQHPKDKAALLALANDYLLARRIDDMIATYDKVLELAPDNIVALNNLAWYLRDRDVKKALAYAEKAHELAPKAASILDTYAMVLLADGQNEKSLRQIERALDAAPGNPLLEMHHARILAANGRRNEAVKLVESLLAREKLPQRAEVEKLLEELKKG